MGPRWASRHGSQPRAVGFDCRCAWNANEKASIFLHYCLLALILAQCTQSATTPKPKNAVEHEPQPSSSHTYVVQTDHLAKPSQFATLGRWYSSMVATCSPRAATTSSSHIIHTYGTVMHGFAVRLTDQEAGRMSRVPGVSGVYKDRAYHTQTTRSPGFLGLHEEFGAWPDSDFGDGVIIGFVDSGIWPESASFDDGGLGPVRPTWKGKCVDAEGFNASLCNNKLVGAKVFTDEPGGAFTPRDKAGHGSHVASTAAGSVVVGANLFEFSRGTARGVAPKARIAMYKACNTEGCYPSGIVAAIDAAVSDGVDIVSMSLGTLRNADFYDDIVAVATFGAERRRVFVVLAGGNQGPDASSVTNVAPWMTTVGAATTDRLFPATLKLGNGVVLSGQSLYTMTSHGVSMIPLVYSGCDERYMPTESLMGKVAVCNYGGDGVKTGIAAQRAGGAGIVDVGLYERFMDGVDGQTFTLPGVTLGCTEFKKLEAYMASVPYPVASFRFTCDTVTGENRAPTVAGFSSRGPNTVVPEILKPDVIAPGVNILAAWSGDAPPSGSEEDPRRVGYNILSGTSMACPHVAGAAALIKKRHGDWTPAMVRSALMTTATPLDKNGRVILDNGVGQGDNDAIDDGICKDAGPLATGSGLILPRLAIDPGLVYDAGTQDYVDLLCTLNYTTEQMRRFVPGMAGCARTLPGGAANLNYPSLVVIFDGRTRVRTLTRTVTKVSAQPVTYNVTVAAPRGVKVTVTPATLEFKRQSEKRSYSIEFRSEAVKPTGVWDFGHVVWENRVHRVRSPVAFLWDN